MIEAFIFDVDGTLADTYPLITRAFNGFAYKYLGRVLTMQELVSKFGPTESEIVGNMVRPEIRREAIEYYYRCYEDFHDGTRLYGGIPELLSELERREKKKAIFTGKGRRSTDITLDKLDIAHRFSPVVTGDDVNCPKPNPEGIITVIEKTGVAPHQTAMVGDHRSDILAGRAAGVFTIAALWHGYNNAALLDTKPDMAFNTPFEMLEWVKNGRGHL